MGEVKCPKCTSDNIKQYIPLKTSGYIILKTKHLAEVGKYGFEYDDDDIGAFENTCIDCRYRF